MNLNGKLVVVLGAGSSGAAASRLALAKGASVCLYDSGDPAKVPDVPGVALVLGPDALRASHQPDLLVLSPGIEPSAPIVRQFGRAPLLGEIEFASRFWARPIVALTGTNGKTTTTGLTAHIFNACGLACVPAGNYGTPFAEVALTRAEDACAVLELSSFQLETIDEFHADVAMWLNFAPDHMDRYATVDDYLSAKREIFRNQTANDWAVVNALNGPSMPLKARTMTFSAFSDAADFTLRGADVLFEGEAVASMNETILSGKHNAENLMAALAAGHARGLPFASMRAAISSYRPPRHRCELVLERDGVRYLNDSKATNLHALESSLRALDGEIILIAGGKRKGLDYSTLQPWLSAKVPLLVAIGEIREQLAELAKGHTECQIVDTLEAAVLLARDRARPGQTVLFSPGTSSFDMFENYEHRGDSFCALVRQHLNSHEQPTPQ